MVDWIEKDTNNIFSIDNNEETEDNEHESNSLLNNNNSNATPKLNQRTIQRQTSTSSPQSPRKTYGSRQPLLSSPSLTSDFQPASPSTAIEMQTADEKIHYATTSGQAPSKQSFIDKLLGRPEPSRARTFNIGTGEDLKSLFPPNIIRNQKYHPSTLVIVVLYNQVINRTKRRSMTLIFIFLTLL